MKRDFIMGQMARIPRNHYSAPRESGLPIGYFDNGPRLTIDRAIFWFCVIVGLSLFTGWAA